MCDAVCEPVMMMHLGAACVIDGWGHTWGGANGWTRTQLIVVETVEIHLLHFIPLCADFSWTAGRLFLNVDPKPSPWRQLHHHLIAAGHSKKDESGLLFWGLRISFVSSKFKFMYRQILYS